MKKDILQLTKTAFLIAGFFTIINSAFGQQHIIADKDETHPEIKNQQYNAAKIYRFSASPMNGYNEIQWTAVAEQDTRRFIVEYSADGINYQSAGELASLDGIYTLKHYTTDARTFLYRIRMEKKDGRFFNSSAFLLNGIDARPVKLYPTIVEGNTVNLQMYLPVQRINIISLDGKQVMQKDIGGNIGFTQLAIPVLSRGQYLITFYGNGWQSTEKFMIAGS